MAAMGLNYSMGVPPGWRHRMNVMHGLHGEVLWACFFMSHSIAVCFLVIEFKVEKCICVVVN